MEIGNQSIDYHPFTLVMEDDDSNFKLIRAIIGKECEVRWAKNGKEIVPLFLENWDKTDAILMDIKTPIMSGLDATQRIRRESGTSLITMQIVYAFSSDHENAINVGASEVLVKPITPGILRNYLNSYLSQLVWQDSTSSTSSPGTCEWLPGFFFSIRVQIVLSCEDFTEDSKKFVEDLNKVSSFSVDEA